MFHVKKRINSVSFVWNSYEIGTKFTHISYQFHTMCCIHTLAEHIRLYEIRTNLVRISRESHQI